MTKYLNSRKQFLLHWIDIVLNYVYLSKLKHTKREYIKSVLVINVYPIDGRGHSVYLNSLAKSQDDGQFRI